MINVNDIEEISNLLSLIFHYGMVNEYALNGIEEKIIKNRYINQLENGDSSFLYEKTLEKIVADIYGVRFEETCKLLNSTISYWLGEIYTRLFFSLNKSFAYLFLYFPIEKALNLFKLYHEMDFNQLLNYFETQVGKKTLLRTLLEKKHMTLSELSSLSKVNYNTIVSYTKNDEHLYSAAFDNIYRISGVLNVKMNLFARKIRNYTNSMMYEFDQNNDKFQLCLTYQLACYYDADICGLKSQLEENSLVSEKGYRFELIKYFVHKTDKSLIATLKEYKQKNDDYQNVMLAVFMDEKTKNSFENFDEFKDLGFHKLFFITSESFISIEGQRVKQQIIYDSVKQNCNLIAKEIIGKDFAV